ncbi:hypothetical protein B0H65DRAFT_161897 [Neurospora tetraspora]|uniref:Uncharacterized protein n=1 Tax=Neurospora tetraspora TaxID=94610 RepID=A0AAE0MTK8_9PEZI|nr:hypothetical protein B0H65DRAFT_161897 [Neurospora tetraspora]
MDFWKKRLAANAAFVLFVAIGWFPSSPPPRFPPDGTDPDLPSSRVQGAKPSKWMMRSLDVLGCNPTSGIPIMVPKRVPSASVCTLFG